MINIAITDDHPLLVNGIKNVLDEYPDINLLASFPDGHQTLEKLDKLKVDVLLLDINLPDIDGIQLCKMLKENHQDLKIIGLTSHKQTAFLKNMMKSGANGFVLKNAPVNEIIEAIQVVADGGEYVQQEMKELLVSESMQRASGISFLPKLTRREKEILKLISEEYTTQEIADKLYLSPKTVETHRQNLILKLGVKNSVGLVKVAIEKGLI
jgi:DNA-binding NarL/FixJ family response regulator